MHCGIELIPLGLFSDPREVVKVAQVAEVSGWEAIWLWDHVLFPYGVTDPWVTLAAVAATTRQIKLVTGVSPVPRYRPELLARQLTALDILSEGRMIFGAGLGVDFDFVPFGVAADAKARGAMTDEGLDLVTRLLGGSEVTHHGEYYEAKAVRVAPSPVQQPRIPIWIGGNSPAALRRAARWDGWIIGTVDEHQNVTLTPEQVAQQAAVIRNHRESGAPFDVAVDGISPTAGRSLVAEYAAAGATWWFEAIYQSRAPYEELIARIKAGPPTR
jgi:alkanesulfonate monooxygenase SsuD/methylene tetrahydromethanopterin reductase-like flavin-dependent oxidoreductase (luciferase family)